jgi:hypothetical protein
VLAVAAEKGKVRLVDPIARTAKEATLEEAQALSSGSAILVTRRLGGAGIDPNTFGFRWFWPSILRYRRPLAHVLVASLFVQVFALATPIFFQLVVDKVLVHKGMSTLVVLVVGMVTLGLFETGLQFLRSYTLSHTTNRIDVELGRRLFHHLFRLPLAYFETRAAGQTVARMAPDAGPRRVGFGGGIERGKRRAGEKQRLRLGIVAKRPAKAGPGGRAKGFGRDELGANHRSNRSARRRLWPSLGGESAPPVGRIRCPISLPYRT